MESMAGDAITDLVRIMRKPDLAADTDIVHPQTMQAAMNTGGVAGTYLQKNRPATAPMVTMSKSRISEVSHIQLTT